MHVGRGSSHRSAKKIHAGYNVLFFVSTHKQYHSTGLMPMAVKKYRRHTQITGYSTLLQHVMTFEQHHTPRGASYVVTHFTRIAHTVASYSRQPTTGTAHRPSNHHLPRNGFRWSQNPRAPAVYLSQHSSCSSSKYRLQHYRVQDLRAYLHVVGWRGCAPSRPGGVASPRLLEPLERPPRTPASAEACRCPQTCAPVRGGYA